MEGKQTLIPAYTRGDRRKTYPPYVMITKKASEARKVGDWAAAKRYRQLAQQIPSRDPNDPNFRRLFYCRYADDFVLGFVGTLAETRTIKTQLAQFLRDELKLELSPEKTLVTHARSEVAHFLGYELHTLQADDCHDARGQRCINGQLGFRVPRSVIHKHRSKYMRKGKPIHLMQRVNDSLYSIVSQYQTELRGIVQYYRPAYNVHQLYHLKRVMEESLAKTIAKKLKTTRARVYKRFKTTIETEHGPYRVLQVQSKRASDEKLLTAHFGGIPIRYNLWVTVNDAPTQPIWSNRSEVEQRLLAQQCQLCDGSEKVEVHHIRKLADLEQRGQRVKPLWQKRMAMRRRKFLVVCQRCHNDIHAGRYDGHTLSDSDHWKAT